MKETLQLAAPAVLEYNEKGNFLRGLGHGLPIALGYLPVSFTFGLMAADGGMPAWIAILISMTNLTSAGQFAGTGLLLAGASLVEITMTTLVINIRYALMSLSLSQKVPPQMSIRQRLLIAFGITDETFSVASMQQETVSFTYLLGLETCPYWGWALGTALGALTCALLPETLNHAMGIALYAMFLALVIPEARKSTPVLRVVLVAAAMNSLLRWLPIFERISSGWSIILSTLMACAVGAVLYPRREEE